MTNCRSPSYSCTSLSSLQASFYRSWAPQAGTDRELQGKHLGWGLSTAQHRTERSWRNQALQWSFLLPRMLSLIPKAFPHFSSPCPPNHLPSVLHISFSIASVKQKHKPPVSTIPSRPGWGMRQISSLFSGLLADQGKEQNTTKSNPLLVWLNYSSTSRVAPSPPPWHTQLPRLLQSGPWGRGLHRKV